jgi:hypothetical protein
MNIHESFLRSFIGGVFYFRWPCFEEGPDYWYLFRSRIIDVELSKEYLCIATEDLYPNRFMLGEWIDHETSSGIQEFRQGENPLLGTNISFQLISPDILYAKLSSSGQGVFYTHESHSPHEPTEVFRDFPNGYERVFGLGLI